MIKVCLLDMDGTTIDSERIYLKASIAAANDLGYNISRETFIYCCAWGNNEHKEVFLKEINDYNFPYEKWVEIMHKHYDEYSRNGEVKLNKGVFELLEYLNSHNIKPCLCTSTNRTRAVNELKKHKIYDLLDHIICGDDVENEKPSGDCHRAAMKYYGITPKEAVVIEDAKCGYEAAKDAGVRCILVPGVIYVSDELKKQADYVANDLLEVIDIIDKIKE